MEIITYNLNGIRAAMRKGLADWVGENSFDVLCFQETKAQPEQVDLEPFRELGYDYSYWHSAKKKGYSGVLTLSKTNADIIVKGIDKPEYYDEGRILRTDFDNITILNCYFPSGTSGDKRQAFKMQFLDDFYNHIEELKKKNKNIIVVGDYNIAHTADDIHNPKRLKNTSGFLPEEREWMTSWFDSGFKDAFRVKNPNKKDDYSWWSYRAASRKRNKGWRIDYQSVSESLSQDIEQAKQLHDVVHSDHCPVYLKISE